MDLEAEMAAGDKARKLLEDKTLQGAKLEVERIIHEAWVTCPTRDRDGAHELKLMIKALNDVWMLLEQALANGKLAAEDFRILNHKD